MSKITITMYDEKNRDARTGLPHSDKCPCAIYYDEDLTDVFNADYSEYEYMEDGVMTYRPLGRYGLIVWPKGWRKSRHPEQLYPLFNIYRKQRAALEFLDHSNYYKPGALIVTKRGN